MSYKVTTKMLEYIRRRNLEGASDPQIGRELSLSPSTVWQHRVSLGLPKNDHKGRPLNTYTVYRRRTSEYVCEGTAAEISKLLGIKVKTIYSTVSRCKRDLGGYRYEIVRVTDDE